MTTWSGTLQIKQQIQLLLNDKSFETNGNAVNMLLPWANSVINEVAMEVDIRNLLDTDTITFTSADKSKALPTDFMRKSDRFTIVNYLSNDIDIVGLDVIRSFDIAHTAITTAGYPQCVALEGTSIYPYPLFTGTLTIDNFYRYPTAMVNDGDSPDIPDNSIRTDLIVAGVVGKYGFPHLTEMNLARFYYDDSVSPRSGRFFQLLEVYRSYMNRLNSQSEEQAVYY